MTMYVRKRTYAPQSLAVYQPAAKRLRRFASRKYGGMRYPTSYFPRISARAPITTQVGQIRRALRQTAPEIKYLDVDVSAANVTENGQIAYVTAIAQGDTLGTRDGEGIRLKSISFKGRVVMPTSATPTYPGFSRVFLFRDKQNASATPATTAVFLDNVTDPVIARPALDTLNRFELLWMSPVFDHRRLVADDGDAQPPTQSCVWDFSWKGDLELRYYGANSTDLSKNPIYVVYTTSDTADTVDFNGSARLGFTDS